MKRFRYVNAFSRGRAYEELEELEKYFKDRESYNSYSYTTIRLDEATDDMQKFLAYVKEKGMQYLIGVEQKIFDDEDWERIPYVWLRAMKPEEISGSCRDYGTQFRYEQCEYCQSGAVQLTPVCFPVEKVLKYELFRLQLVLVVSSTLKSKLEAINAAGCEFREIVDYKTGQVDHRFYQLVIENYLPATSSTTRVMYTCRDCHRQSLHVDGTMEYKLSDFSTGKDFYYSKESMYLGPSFYSDREHEIIISKRVKELLPENISGFVRPIYFEEFFGKR